jgi:hypothetical protein
MAGVPPDSDWRPMPETVWNRRDAKTYVAFAKWVYNQLFGSLTFRFPYDDIPRNMTFLEKVLRFPVLGRVPARFLYVDSRGIEEAEYDARSQVRTQEARLSDDLRDVAIALVAGQELTEAQKRLMQVEAYRKRVRRHTETVRGKMGTATERVLATTRSKAERAAIIRRAQELGALPPP